MMKTLLITPPFIQPNTPYAATPLLTAWLIKRGYCAKQTDLSLLLLLKLFSESGIRILCQELADSGKLASFVEAQDDFCETIEPVIRFMQGKEPALARVMVQEGWLPIGPNLAEAYELEGQLGWNYRGLDEQDLARYLASLYLDDIAEAARELDPLFGFSRYAESLSASLPTFEPLKKTVHKADTLFSRWLTELTEKAYNEHKPDVVAITVPFPGCLFGSIYIAKEFKRLAPSCHITLGGGYVNTELRELADSTIFDFVDSIILDSGFLPLERLIAFFEGNAKKDQLVRTFMPGSGVGEVQFFNTEAPPIRHADLPAPVYEGLPLNDYVGMFEKLNPVTRLWSDGRWNKLVLAHGCCWSRCAFCDTSIDYICRYDPADAETICDWIEAVIQETDFNGFHFVDEALPPDLLNALCDEIIRRNLQIEWWGNVRFEKRFAPALINKMAQSGCIAVTGGVETACDRTLKLMRKGITIKHAKEVLARFSRAGIMTHAYLMYGFPTQTFNEILQALDTIRELFECDHLHSAYWHRFALTAHSSMALAPQRFSIEPLEISAGGFAVNEIPFTTNFDYDRDIIGERLHAAVYNYNLGIGMDLPVEVWFEM